MNDQDNSKPTDSDVQYHLLYLPRGIQRLQELGVAKTYHKNYILNIPDTVPDCCYIVISGSVACYEYSYAGDERVYNIMETGSMFLEECLLFDRPCPVQFRTLEKCELIEIGKCDLKRAFKHDIDVVMDVCESLSTKFLSSMEHLRLGPRQGASWKICKMLLIYADHHGQVQPDGSIIIKRRVSQQMLADILGLNRITVTRKLKELKSEGLVDNENGYIKLPDINAIRQYMIQLESE